MSFSDKPSISEIVDSSIKELENRLKTYTQHETSVEGMTAKEFVGNKEHREATLRSDRMALNSVIGSVPRHSQLFQEFMDLDPSEFIMEVADYDRSASSLTTTSPIEEVQEVKAKEYRYISELLDYWKRIQTAIAPPDSDDQSESKSPSDRPDLGEKERADTTGDDEGGTQDEVSKCSK